MVPENKNTKGKERSFDELLNKSMKKSDGKPVEDDETVAKPKKPVESEDLKAFLAEQAGSKSKQIDPKDYSTPAAYEQAKLRIERKETDEIQAAYYAAIQATDYEEAFAQIKKLMTYPSNHVEGMAAAVQAPFLELAKINFEKCSLEDKVEEDAQIARLQLDTEKERFNQLNKAKDEADEKYRTDKEQILKQLGGLVKDKAAADEAYAKEKAELLNKLELQKQTIGIQAGTIASNSEELEKNNKEYHRVCGERDETLANWSKTQEERNNLKKEKSRLEESLKQANELIEVKDTIIHGYEANEKQPDASAPNDNSKELNELTQKVMTYELEIKRLKDDLAEVSGHLHEAVSESDKNDVKPEGLQDELPAESLETKADAFADGLKELSKKYAKLKQENSRWKEEVRDVYKAFFDSEDAIEDYINEIKSLEGSASIGIASLVKDIDASVSICELVGNVNKPKLRIVEGIGDDKFMPVSKPKLGRTYAVEIDPEINISGFRPYRAIMTVFHIDGKTNEVKFEKTMRAGIVDLGSGEYTIRSRSSEPFVFGKTLDCSNDIVQGTVEILLVPEKTKVYK